MQKILTLTLLLTVMLNAPALLAMKVDSTDTLVQRALATLESSNIKTYPVIIVNKSEQSLLVAPQGKTAEIVHQNEAYPLFFSSEESFSSFSLSSPKGVTGLSAFLGDDKNYIIFALSLMQKRQWVFIEEKRSPLPINHLAILVDKRGSATFIDRTNVQENCYQAHLLKDKAVVTLQPNELDELVKIQASLNQLVKKITP